MKKGFYSYSIFISFFIFLAGFNMTAQNPIAIDVASNYDNNDFTGEGNLGTGFGAWFTDSNNGGRFLGTATNNGASNNSIMNSDEKAFGMWATDFSDVGRNFTALEIDDRLSFRLSFQWDNGNKGVNLYTGGVNIDEIFNFNINSGGYSWTGGGSSPITGWDSNGDRQNGVTLQFEFAQTATGLDYKIEMLAGDAQESESNYFGVKEGSITFIGSVNALKFYVSGAGGDGGNLYFNFLQIDEMAPLPLDFISFTAQRELKGVTLDWQYEATADLSHYVLEHSMDALRWQALETFREGAEVSARSSGQFVHEQALAGRNYYLLRAVGFSGEERLSPVRSVMMGQASGVRLVNTLVDRELLVQRDQIGEALTLELANGHGQVLQALRWIDGAQQHAVPMGNLPAGMYFLRVSDGLETEVFKVVKR